MTQQRGKQTVKPKVPPKKVRFQSYYYIDTILSFGLKKQKPAAASGSEPGDGMSDSGSAYELKRKAKIRANKTIQAAILCQVIHVHLTVHMYIRMYIYRMVFTNMTNAQLCMPYI